MSEAFDVLIVGAGLSGIGAAWHLQKNCPNKRYAILENRSQMGGTWDLFRYPGIRSDSDMYTLGYVFRPWPEAKAIADGPQIRKYINDTARDAGIDKHIHYQHKVLSANWSSTDAQWTVTVARGEQQDVCQLRCNFLLMCSGYYNYEAGYTPDFPGIERFAGQVVHPQKWTADIDYAGKRVIVIGSGATAVTLVPSMAATAAHVTMLQRSPTYIFSAPSHDKLANQLREWLPSKLAYILNRWKRVLLGMFFYQLSKRRPEKAKAFLLKQVRQELRPDFDIGKHFTPNYKPWDQRVCLVPDSDLFKAINSERAEIVTDHIESFSETGITLKSGRELAADLIVTATGLDLQLFGGMQLSVDGQPVDMSKTFNYKGMMFNDVPNLAAIIGYTNASWTLKADLVSHHVCRLLKHMDATGSRQCVPRMNEADMQAEPWADFNSSYVLRSVDKFPKQGLKKPWRLYQNYPKDIWLLKYGPVTDEALEFSAAPQPTPKNAQPS